MISAEHRARWDATFSAPKSVSLTALVGGDNRVRKAHRESVRAALQELERYTQARIGNVHAPETTGKFIAATFEHDTARPVDGYAAPQLHTHAVIFNMTERENGLENGKQMRALQPHEMFVSQRYATAVYRSELALRLEKLGYELERGKHGQPEVKGYTKEYLEASSPRRGQIKDHLREQGIDGAAAAQIAAHHTRDRKEMLSPEEVLQRHRELAAQYGHQADRVVAQARQHGQYQMPEPEMQAQRAVTWARDHVFERSAVQDRRAILETALVRGMGETTYAQVRQEFERRIEAGEFREVSHIGAGQQYTTAAMVRMEREIVGRMQEGNRRDYIDPMLVSSQLRIATEDRRPELNTAQRQAVDEILLSREKVVGLDGIAGAGKTTTLSVIREGAEAEGYRVEGFAPTSRAAQKLGEAGMETSTLQKHLVRGQQQDTGEKRLYVLDESSLASTRQVHEFVNRLNANDRVLLVGDRRQHEAVEAGRPFAQLQDAGMKTVKLEEIVRQKDPELKQVVEQLARGEVREAIQSLDRQGRIHEIQGHDERIAAIAKEYAKSPDNTLVISPDNRSRTEINGGIHAELQRARSTTSGRWCGVRTSLEPTGGFGGGVFRGRQLAVGISWRSHIVFVDLPAHDEPVHQALCISVAFLFQQLTEPRELFIWCAHHRQFTGIAGFRGFFRRGIVFVQDELSCSRSVLLGMRLQNPSHRHTRRSHKFLVQPPKMECLTLRRPRAARDHVQLFLEVEKCDAVRVFLFRRCNPLPSVVASNPSLDDGCRHWPGLYSHCVKALRPQNRAHRTRKCGNLRRRVGLAD